MASLTSTVQIDLGAAAEAISRFGLPNPLDWLADVDGDPDAIATAIDEVNVALQAISDAAGPILSGQRNVVWTGAASIDFAAFVDGFVEGVRAVADFLLYLVEQVLQIIDYILDLFRWVLNAIILLCGILGIIIAVMAATIAALAASVFGSPGIPAVIAQAGFASWTALMGTSASVIGAIAIFATIFAMVIRFLDWIVDGLIEILHGWRVDLGDRFPELPDWEPGVPPVLPT